MKQQVVLKTNLVVYTYVVGSTKKLPTLTAGQHGHSCIRSAAPYRYDICVLFVCKHTPARKGHSTSDFQKQVTSCQIKQLL